MLELSDDYLFSLENTKDVVILVDIKKKSLCFWNKAAESLYGIQENTCCLEDIFQPSPETLAEMIHEMVTNYPETATESFFPNLNTVTQDGSGQVVDLTIRYANKALTAIALQLVLREDTRLTVAKEMIDSVEKPLFLVDLTSEMDVFYANDLFYTTFTIGKEAFQHYYKNSFSATLLDMDIELLFSAAKKELLTSKSYRQDIQISTVHGVKKWFLLELQIFKIGHEKMKLLGTLIPIAQRIEVSNRLEQMNQYLTAIQELTTGALFYVNPKGKFSHHSSLLKSKGYPNEMDNFPKCIFPMVHQDDIDDLQIFFDKMMAGSTESHQFRYKTGTEISSWAKVSGLPIRNADGEISEIVGRVKNIDDEVELVKQATIDPLTNALNKEFVKETVENIFQHTVQTTEKSIMHALFFMDLDNFKYVNDNLGHKFGDYLLKELGVRFSSSVRSGDIIGRVGGDEFIFLIRNIPNMSMLLEKAQRLLKTIGEEFQEGDITHKISGSIGIAVYPEHGNSYGELYHNADLALYRSKHRGKNMATLYKPSMGT